MRLVRQPLGSQRSLVVCRLTVTCRQFWQRKQVQSAVSQRKRERERENTLINIINTHWTWPSGYLRISLVDSAHAVHMRRARETLRVSDIHILWPCPWPLSARTASNGFRIQGFCQRTLLVCRMRHDTLWSTHCFAYLLRWTSFVGCDDASLRGFTLYKLMQSYDIGMGNGHG